MCSFNPFYIDVDARTERFFVPTPEQIMHANHREQLGYILDGGGDDALLALARDIAYHTCRSNDDTDSVIHEFMACMSNVVFTESCSVVTDNKRLAVVADKVGIEMYRTVYGSNV